MTIKEAYNIRRIFYTDKKIYKPFTLNNLGFYKYKNSVKIRSFAYDITYANINIDKFIKQKELFDIEFVYSYDYYDEYQLHQKVYITSQGIVSEEDYELAGDIIDNLTVIPKKDLKEDVKYISDKGREYFYIKNDRGSLYDNKYKKQVLKDSIRIVDIIL